MPHQLRRVESILADPEQANFFTQFLEQEGSNNELLFSMEYENFKRSIESHTGIQICNWDWGC